MDNKEALFNELYPEISRIIERRRGGWTLSTMPWEDASAHLMEKIWANFDKYDPERPLDRWVNTVVTHAIMNLLRDNLVKHSRPCVAASAYGCACAFNRGGDLCGWTKSGIQDSSCKFLAKWLKKKHAKFAISTPLSIENHTDEYYTKPGEIVTEEWIADKKKIIDSKIARRLSKEEGKIYKLLFIQGLEEKEVGEKMGYKKQTNSEVRGYLQIRAAKIKIREVAEQIISEEGIVP